MCIRPLPPPPSNVGVHMRLVHPQCTIIGNIELGERGARSKSPNVPTVLYKVAVSRCKQINNKNFKIVHLKPENSKKEKKNKEKKTTFFGILNIRSGILLYSKNFFQFFKIRGGRWRTTKQLSFFLGLRIK